MTAFVKQCWQVWRTWINWPVFRVMCLVMIAEWLTQIGGFSLDQAWQSNGVQFWVGYFLSAAAFLDHLIPVLLAVAVPVMIFGRIKSQMTSWRSVLAPRFHIPHLFVGFFIGALIFLLIGVLPTAIPLWNYYVRMMHNNHLWTHHPIRHSVSPYFWTPYHFSPSEFVIYRVWPAVADLAWALFAAALIGWLIGFLAAWVILPASGLIFALYVLDMNHLLTISVSGFGSSSIIRQVEYDPSLTILLIFGDALLLIGLWLRLAHLPVGAESVKADERVPWLSALLVAAQRAPSGGLMRAGILRRAGHRRLIGLGRRFVWLIAVYTAGLICLRPMVNHVIGPADAGEFFFEAFFLTGVVSILAIGLSWPRHFAELNEIELMRPATRRACAKEIGLAMLFDAAELCFAMALAVIAVSDYWLPAGLHYPAFWILLAAAILSQVLTFGLIVWTMLLRSTAASVIALALAVISFTMLLYFTLDDRVIFPALLAAALGIALTIHAHRRWLRADMVYPGFE